MPRRYFNWKLAIVLFIGCAVFGVSVFGLRQWRKATGQGMGVESDVVLPKDLMTALAGKNPQTEAEIAKILQDTPWRLRRYGETILEVLKS